MKVIIIIIVNIMDDKIAKRKRSMYSIQYFDQGFDSLFFVMSGVNTS